MFRTQDTSTATFRKSWKAGLVNWFSFCQMILRRSPIKFLSYPDSFYSEPTILVDPVGATNWNCNHAATLSVWLKSRWGHRLRNTGPQHLLWTWGAESPCHKDFVYISPPSLPCVNLVSHRLEKKQVRLARIRYCGHCLIFSNCFDCCWDKLAQIQTCGQTPVLDRLGHLLRFVVLMRELSMLFWAHDPAPA